MSPREVYRAISDCFDDLAFKVPDRTAFRQWGPRGWVVPERNYFLLRPHNVRRAEARALILRVRTDLTHGTLLTVCGENSLNRVNPYRGPDTIMLGFLWGLDPTWNPMGVGLLDLLPSLQPLPTDWQHLLAED